MLEENSNFYRWSDIDTLPPNDPVFDLSIHSLTKLQPYRDMSSLLRTIPDLATFRTAHRFIRAWAKHRGIYAARFGYLGGVHITMMLSRLCKLYFHDAPIITAADIICTFFKHYAEFDWDNEIVYDSLFFKGKKPRYRRYPNEPMVILTLHAPIMNVARAASVPSQRTIVEELRRADQLLSGDEIMWSSVINGPGDGSTTGLDDGAREFLKTYSTYVKINVQYWGLSLAKGSALVGWLESRCLYLLVGKFQSPLSLILVHISNSTQTSTESSLRSTPESGHQDSHQTTQCHPLEIRNIKAATLSASQDRRLGDQSPEARTSASKRTMHF